MAQKNLKFDVDLNEADSLVTVKSDSPQPPNKVVSNNKLKRSFTRAGVETEDMAALKEMAAAAPTRRSTFMRAASFARILPRAHSHKNLAKKKMDDYLNTICK